MADSFPCDCCGICCETLIRLDVYNDLDDGTGHCRYYDRISHLCTIYEHRPEKCNVMASYKYYKDQISLEDYIAINVQGCNLIKEGL